MANTYHSIIFEDGTNRFHTWDNWHLIPSTRPVIVQPTPLYKYVDIPGRDGSLDITDYLIGRPVYSDRKGSLEFIAANTLGNTLRYGDKRNFSKDNSPGGDYYYFQRRANESYGNWSDRRSEIAAFLNGRKMKMFLEDDPNFYYYGRVFFKEWRPDPQFSKVIIEYQVNPYKYSRDGKEAVL